MLSFYSISIRLNILAFLAATLWYTDPVMAMDDEAYYVGVSLGRAFGKIDGKSDEGTITEAVIGQYSNKSDVSFEGAYVEMDDYDVFTPSGTNTVQSNYKINALKLIAAKHLIYTPKWYMNIKAGFVYWREEIDIKTRNTSGNLISWTGSEKTGGSIYVGLGYSYALSSDTRVNLTVERFETKNAEFANALIGAIFSFD